MKLPQIIATTAVAIAFGYIGSQYLNRNAMYAIGGGMAGLGAMTYLAPSKSKEESIHTQSNSST